METSVKSPEALGMVVYTCNLNVQGEMGGSLELTDGRAYWVSFRPVRDMCASKQGM